ncbi:putative pentatricopeptide repeat-containing protein At3g25970 [Curcuma longa]|uniref:putative pentatricopeptide repeat-containing protein At3g25970 n=1 Tax=Curcuma longa TaxID=136217 RepID=UPI003D9E427D
MSCSSLRPASAVRSVAAKTHARLLKSGNNADVVGWNKILTAYSAAGSGPPDARKLFDEMPQRDVVSWNALVAAHVASGSHRQAWAVFQSMLSAGLRFNQYTLSSLLKSAARAAEIELGRQLHASTTKSGFDRDVFVGSALLDVYAKCLRMRDAVMVFEQMPEPNAVTWSAVIAGHARVGDADAALRALRQMERAGFKLEEATFAGLLTSLDAPSYHESARQVHAKIVKFGEAMGINAYNAAITAYSQCGAVEDSRKIFDKMENPKDLVSWNSLLAAYACHGLAKDAMDLFVTMQKVGIEQDMYTFTSAISACFEQGNSGEGRALHALVIKRGFDATVNVSNALIAMYGKPGAGDTMEDAWKAFEFMELKDSISWNTLLTGLSQNGRSEESLRLFALMMKSETMEIDHYAFSAALRSCADLAVLQLGQQIHRHVLRRGFAANEFAGSALIFMYAKCGILDDAHKAFDETLNSSPVAWNSMIFGYAQHGQGRVALSLFSKMHESGVEPDHITFVGLLTACSHSGLVEEGTEFLQSMQPVFGVALRMEHYACGVDLFGRAGQLDEAMKLVESMPFEPDEMVWLTLLGACRVRGDLKLASHVAGHLLVSEPKHHSTYVLLSHMYSGAGMWNDRTTMQRTMRSRGLSKVPGWSWVEIMNQVHCFNAEDRSHPQVEKIYEMLEILTEMIATVSTLDTEVFEFKSICPPTRNFCTSLFRM